MRHIWILGAVGAVSGLLCYGYSASTSAAEADPLDNVLTQLPDVAIIRQELAVKPALSQGERQDMFANLFTQRFRAHDSKVAVRARFVEAKPGYNAYQDDVPGAHGTLEHGSHRACGMA